MCANAKHKRGSEETQSAINLRRNGYIFTKVRFYSVFQFFIRLVKLKALDDN